HDTEDHHGRVHRAAERLVEGEQDDHRGHREDHVREPAGEAVEEATEVARDEARGDADDDRDHDRDESSDERVAPAHEQAAEDVAAGAIAAEQVLAARLGEDLVDPDLTRGERGEHRPDDAEEHDERQHDRGAETHRVRQHGLCQRRAPRGAQGDGDGIGCGGHCSLAFGLLQPLTRSISRLTSTTTMTSTTTTRMSAGVSPWMAELTVRVPRPGRAKIFSMTTAPPSCAMNCSESTMSAGGAALRSTWRSSTDRRPRPRACSVRT